jgi:hypothetical protein
MTFAVICTRAREAAWEKAFFPLAPFRSPSVYDAAGNVIETREHKSDFKEW